MAFLLITSSDYLSDPMHVAFSLPSVFSAGWQSEVAVADGESVTQAAGSAPGNTTLQEPKVQEEEEEKKCLR